MREVDQSPEQSNRYIAIRIESESDPRHAELVIRDLGLEHSKAGKVPGAKEHGDDKRRLDAEPRGKHKRRAESYVNIIDIY